jgi:hypothetical protein
MLSMSLALVGAGAAVLSITGPAPLQDGWARLGLGIVAFGFVALAVSTVIPIPAGSNSLESWPYIIATGLGLLAIAGGSLVMVLALVRASARTHPSR